MAYSSGTVFCSSLTKEVYNPKDVPVCVSPQFYGWVCGFGGKVEVTAPAEVRKGIHDMVQALSLIHILVSFGCQGHFIGEGPQGYLHACIYLAQLLRTDGSSKAHIVM